MQTLGMSSDSGLSYMENSKSIQRSRITKLDDMRSRLVHAFSMHRRVAKFE